MSICIPCPHCGERPVEEFVYGEILDTPATITDEHAIAFDRAFMHTNREGPVVEAWFHTAGCRRWIRIGRDTRDDQIDDPSSATR